MPTINDRTPEMEFPLPHPDNDLSDDVLRLRAALLQIDSSIAGLPTGSRVETIENSLIALAAAVLAVQTGGLSQLELAQVTDLLNTARPDSATLTYTDGMLTGATEALHDGTRTTVLTYTPDGALASAVQTYAGRVRTTVLTYTGGLLTGFETTEVDDE
ncbi:hypothetical protein [Thauera butanivorans]|uniref:hypothetical protein n=1 Tax=Thauera butanivorans TaxID=86174 RepID=UPI000838FF92|nr:hypothetical protein [Thauera butanivorans]